jgi:cation diffusion facilitator family transporter
MHPARKALVLSFATALVTLAVKFAAYAITGSVGLLADATETLVNVVAAVLALLAMGVALRPPDDGHAYGHGKIEYFSSGTEALLIVLAGLAILYQAAQRFAHPALPEHLPLGLAATLFATFLNFATARVLARVARRYDSITLEADAAHLSADVATSIAVVAGLIVVVLKPAWQILDPLIAGAVALHILWVGFDLVRRSVDGLMDRALAPEELATIRRLIEAELPAGRGYGSLRTRKAGARRFIEFVLTVPGSCTVLESHELCNTLEAAIRSRLREASVFIHVEPALTPDD